jgi:EAL domain-containing protein (putative c-di-GMP-specific phosphodiesterase class I)
MIAMAQSLGIEVIAEGIETTGQRDLLAYMGCRYGQGYLLGRPTPSKELWLSETPGTHQKRLASNAVQNAKH